MSISFTGVFYTPNQNQKKDITEKFKNILPYLNNPLLMVSEIILMFALLVFLKMYKV